MIIKDRTIGEGKPCICVPIVSPTIAGIKTECKKIASCPAEIIEWRIDYFLKNNAWEQCFEAANSIKELLPYKPFLITYRTAFEGGEEKYPDNKRVTEEEYISLIYKMMELEPDMIDIEAARASDDTMKTLVASLKAKNIVTVLSMHDFDKTPDDDILAGTFERMNRLGGDIFKTAVMPHDSSDVLRLMSFSNEAAGKYDNPLITISMGQTGLISRVAGELDHSSVTFASVTKASAPGQIRARDLAKMLNKVSMEKRNVYLVGFMGCGKSTIAKELSKKLRMDMIDTDDAIVEREGISIPDIFEKCGEAGFRDIETDTLRDLSSQGNKVIACGGGIVLRDENIRIMKRYGVVVLLTAKAENVLKRVSGDTGRPLLKGKMNVNDIQAMMDARSERYKRAADYTVETDDKPVNKVVVDILHTIP